MSRKIVIKDCADCPHVGHKGGFGTVSYIPVCRRAEKEMPYKIAKGHGSMVVARQTGGIPDWCPLPKD